MGAIKKNLNKQNFVTGALVLAGAGVLARLIGIAFRIPLVNIVGNYGMGLYQMVFPLYALLLIISSAGVPVAISKMIARGSDSHTSASPKEILLNSIVLLSIIGAIISTIFFIFANQIATMQGNSSVGKIYMAIAPAVLLVSIIGAFRGYFQGLKNMVPTAASQVLEQIVKVGAGLTLAIMLYPAGVEWAVFGAILAVSISELIALAMLMVWYKVSNKNVGATSGRPCRISFSLMWMILKKSVPITAMAAIFPLILVFDSMVVINMLESGGASNQVATQLYGISSGTVHTLINMPAVLGVAVGVAVVPMTASLIKDNNKAVLAEKSVLAIKLIFVIALFFTLFYIAFSREIIVLLYERAFKDAPADQLRIATKLLKIESIMILFMGLSMVFTSLLQGAGRAKFPLVALAIGGTAKIVFQLIFIRTRMGIFAVSIGNVLCFVITFVILWVFVLKLVDIKPKIKKEVWRSILLTLLYSTVLIGLVKLMPDGKWWIMLSGTIAVVFYGLFVWMLSIFHPRRLNDAK